ncbi:MAG TPA: hypothetical protein DEF68_01435 [Elusimicrobia bacterium]|jgi:hypothetical protein|nr:hypothetical protein [Elusimicrobiota bacterium]HBW22025.1 hypothetical protein [Elusimicrobiota bacterium]
MVKGVCMTDSGPIVVYETPDPTEAECVRQALESEDIFCRLLHTNANKMIALGMSLGIQIVVPSEQAARAGQIIKEFINSR